MSNPYLAGLFDAEGSFSIQANVRWQEGRGSVHFNPRTSMTLKRGDILEELLHRRYGGSITYRHKEDSYGWATGELRTQRIILKDLLPHLRIKRRIAERFAEAIDTFPPIRANHAAGQRTWSLDAARHVAAIAFELNPESSSTRRKTPEQFYAELERAYEGVAPERCLQVTAKGPNWVVCQVEGIETTVIIPDPLFPLPAQEAPCSEWFAGLFDGDGCFHFKVYERSGKPVLSKQISLGLAHGADMLDLFVERYGGGIYNQGNHRQAWKLTVREHMLRFLDDVEPHLLEKGDQAHVYRQILEAWRPRAGVNLYGGEMVWDPDDLDAMRDLAVRLRYGYSLS